MAAPEFWLRKPRSAEEMARRWQALADRRRAHLLEMHRSGRWQRYYTEEELLAQVHDAVRCADMWAKQAGAPPQAEDAHEAVVPLREAAE